MDFNNPKKQILEHKVIAHIDIPLLFLEFLGENFFKIQNTENKKWVLKTNQKTRLL